jgi:ABC-type multidrug transport system fused ATPase/permease subunit
MSGFFMQFFEVIALETMGQRVMQDIRVELFNHILRLKTPFFDTSPVGRVVTRVTNDIENLHNLFTAILVNQFKDVFLLMGILAVLFNIEYRLALLVLILVPFIILVSFLFSRWARDVFRDIRALIGQINAAVQETLSGIRILQVFQQEHRRAEVFRKINSRTYEANIRQVKIFAFFMPLIEIIGSFAVALIIWRGGMGIIAGGLSLGALVAFLSYIRMFFRPIRDLAEKYNIMQSAMASTERIFQLMDMERETEEERDASSSESDVRFAKEFEKDITFSRVWFRYGEDKWVFRDLSITFEARKTTAVVGPTGAGKSSMIYLLDRFYHPEKGVITIGSRDIRQVPLHILRKNIGFVLQDVRLFSGTLWENILLGAAEKDRAYAAGVLNRLGIPDFSDRFQEGLETRLGEEGRGMSSGERQIIAFARAFAVNPPILVLDEATASVDPLTERLIQQALHVLLKGRTAIVIAHRLSTIRRADRIVVIQDGHVAESGTHASLIEDSGLYARYHRIQGD